MILIISDRFLNLIQVFSVLEQWCFGGGMVFEQIWGFGDSVISVIVALCMLLGSLQYFSYFSLSKECISVFFKDVSQNSASYPPLPEIKKVTSSQKTMVFT